MSDGVRRTSVRRRLAAALLAGAVLVLPTGCIRMPESGPVVQTRSDGSLANEPPIYIDPKPPQPGASALDIVNGFLDAMTATPIQTNVAKQFLTRDAQATWNPERQTITYAEVPSARGTSRQLSVTLSEAHRLDSRGTWRGSLEPPDNILQFPMEQEDGEWRISRPPDALVVPESWFEQRFRQVSLYFFDPTAQILVPEPVFVPRGEQLASALTSALLQGPGPGLSRVTRTFIPPGLKVYLSVTVSPQGVADISLRGDAGQETPEAIELMVAQLAWTLRQEPAIRALRISIGGEPVTLPGGVSEFSVDQGAEFDPTGFQASSLLYGLRDGMLVSGNATSLEAVDGPLGEKDYGVENVALNLIATRVAAVSGGGRAVLVAPARGRSGKVHQIVSGASHLLRPAWDFSDRLWLVDDAKGGARVSYVEGERSAPLRVPGVSGRKVRSFLVSRDSTRFVAVVRGRTGDSLVVSRIVHDDQGRVVRALRAHRISPAEDGEVRIRDIAWQSTTMVAVLNVINGKLSKVSTIALDGSPPGLDSLATTLRGRVLALAGSPVDSESLYAVTQSSLIDLSDGDGGPIPLDPRVSTLGYVG